jgi:hypothetical protein
VQAVPLVMSAALGHILFGDFQLGLTASLLIGSIPGVYLGARASANAPDGVIRPALVTVLVLSGMKLLGASNGALGGVLVFAAVVGAGLLARTRKRAPLPDARPSDESQSSSEAEL